MTTPTNWTITRAELRPVPSSCPARTRYSEWLRETRSKARLYLSVVGEHPINKNVLPATMPEPTLKERRVIAKQALEMSGIDSNAAKLTWSRVAGCSCGCSPGFVVDGLHGATIYVDVAFASPVEIEETLAGRFE